jgi:hypothetical protein
MKKVFLQTVFICYCFFCFSQENDIKFSFSERNRLNPIIDTISQKQFVSIRKNGIQSIPQPWIKYQNLDSLNRVYKDNEGKNTLKMDSLFRKIRLKYSNSFSQTDSCLILKAIDTLITICNYQNDSLFQHWSTYKLKDFYKGYLIFLETGYESWDYILFNPKTKKYCFISDYPYFINDTIIYSSGSYYGDGQFELFCLKNDKLYFRFDTFNWEMEECYRLNRVFYIALKSMKTLPYKVKYIKVDFNGLF